MSEVKNKICPKCGTQMLRSLDGYICPKCGIQTFGEMTINPPEVTLEEALKILREDADWDWEKFRKEAVKDILCAMVSGGYSQGRVQEQAKLAKRYVDELIKLLRDGEK